MSTEDTPPATEAVTKCDGNHGGPRCADPGCWNDTPEEEAPRRFSQNCINNFCECRFCFEEKPRGVTMAAYSRLHVGFTDRGLQVWCARHQVNVVHLDFEGKNIRGSGTVDSEDAEALVARAPLLEEILVQNALMPLQAGRVVAMHRLSMGHTTAPEVLRAFSGELDRYLCTGVLSPDWQQALEMTKQAAKEKAGGLILPPGS